MTKRDPVRIGIVTVSDRASKGVYQDLGGPAIRECLSEILSCPWTALAKVIPDEKLLIEDTLRELCDQGRCCLVVTTGGTGPAKRDVTPEATEAVCEKLLDGFGEQMRAVAQVCSDRHPVPPDRGHSWQVPYPEFAGQTKCHPRLLAGSFPRNSLLHRPDRRAVFDNTRVGRQGVSTRRGRKTRRRGEGETRRPKAKASGGRDPPVGTRLLLDLRPFEPLRNRQFEAWEHFAAVERVVFFQSDEFFRGAVNANEAVLWLNFPDDLTASGEVFASLTRHFPPGIAGAQYFNS